MAAVHAATGVSGSIFVAAILSEWTKQFDLASTIQKAGSALKTLRFSREKVAALVSVILIATSLGQTVKILYGAYIDEADDSYKKVIRFLNDDTPAGALIETYDSEVILLAQSAVSCTSSGSSACGPDPP